MVEVGPRSLPVVLDAQPDGTAQGVGLGQPRGERNTLLNLLPPLRFRLSAVVEAESPTRIPKASAQAGATPGSRSSARRNAAAAARGFDDPELDRCFTARIGLNGSAAGRQSRKEVHDTTPVDPAARLGRKCLCPGVSEETSVRIV